MIPIEQQVVSLELAKRLKTLGVRQESAHYWRDDRDCAHNELVPDCKDCEHVVELLIDPVKDNSPYFLSFYSAFTFVELWIKLPTGINLIECSYHVTENAISIRDTEERFKNVPALFCQDYNIANLAARFLIYLIENSYLTEIYPVNEAQK